MSASNPEPLLGGLLRRVLCPTPTQTLLLLACLNGDLEAWEHWCQKVGDPKHELGNDSIGIKRLVPLLYVALRDANADLDAEFLSYLRAAYVREELRSRTFRRVCSEALHALAQRPIPFVVLPGVSLAESAYPVWALRHCHDVDLLVDHADFSAAISVLREFRLYAEDEFNTTLVHPTNLPVSLHARLFEHYSNLPRLFEEAVQTSITDVDVRVLAPHHELLRICVHAASGPNRRMLLWVADALHLLRSNADLDWEKLVEASVKVALPTYVMLGYLSVEIGAEVPAFVLPSLAKMSGSHQGEALKRASATAGYRGLMAEAQSGSEKVMVFRWLLREIPAYYRKKRKA